MTICTIISDSLPQLVILLDSFPDEVEWKNSCGRCSILAITASCILADTLIFVLASITLFTSDSTLLIRLTVRNMINASLNPAADPCPLMYTL